MDKLCTFQIHCDTVIIPKGDQRLYNIITGVIVNLKALKIQKKNAVEFFGWADIAVFCIKKMALS